MGAIRSSTMGVHLETILGTVRLYDYRRPSSPGTQAVSYRARLWSNGKYRDGKLCRTHRLAVESLLDKLQVGAGTNKSILDRREFPMALRPQARSQPCPREKASSCARLPQGQHSEGSNPLFCKSDGSNTSNAAVAPRSHASLFQLACDGTKG